MQPGGLNFDAKVRRESTNTKDLFIAHIGAMDSFARGLRNAAKIVEDGIMAKYLKVKPLYEKENVDAVINIERYIFEMFKK